MDVMRAMGKGAMGWRWGFTCVALLWALGACSGSETPTAALPTAPPGESDTPPTDGDGPGTVVQDDPDAPSDTLVQCKAAATDATPLYAGASQHAATAATATRLWLATIYQADSEDATPSLRVRRYDSTFAIESEVTRALTALESVSKIQMVANDTSVDIVVVGIGAETSAPAIRFTSLDVATETLSDPVTIQSPADAVDSLRLYRRLDGALMALWTVDGTLYGKNFGPDNVGDTDDGVTIGIEADSAGFAAAVHPGAETELLYWFAPGTENGTHDLKQATLGTDFTLGGTASLVEGRNVAGGMDATPIALGRFFVAWRDQAAPDLPRIRGLAVLETLEVDRQQLLSAPGEVPGDPSLSLFRSIPAMAYSALQSGQTRVLQRTYDLNGEEIFDVNEVSTDVVNPSAVMSAATESLKYMVAYDGIIGKQLNISFFNCSG